MAEALGIASGAAGLLSLAIEVTKLSYSYIASVRGAPKALTSYIGELATLTSVLLQLDDFVQSKRINNQHADTLGKALEDCKREIEQLKAKLEKKVSWGGIKAKVAALAWPFSEAEMQDKVNMLHRYNGIFSSALQADSFAIAIANNKELRELRQDAKTKEIVAWYQPDVEMESSASHLEEYCPSTCSTFLTSLVYQEWRSGSSPVLWAYGKPGAGKTVLSVIVLKDIKSDELPDTAIAYHFFSSDRPKESLTNVLRHLIAQALHGCSSIPQAALDLYKRNSLDLTTTDLVNVLKSIAESRRTCIILDGLDECPWLSELLSVLSTLQSIGVKLFATSRDLPKVRTHFKNHPSLEVTATSQDLHLYVTHRLKHGEVDFDLIGEQLITDLVSVIDKEAAGSFLLARLTIDRITGLLTVKEIRKSLTSLPTNFQEAYHGTLDRIVKQTAGLKDLALRSLSIMCHVRRPLKILELQHALVVEDGMLEVDPEDLKSSKTIISACLGLVVLSKSEQTVEFVHSTARQFLRSTPVGLDKHPNLTIVQTCLSYMSTAEMHRGPCTSFQEMQQRFKEQPFLRYAANFYGYHVQAIERVCIGQLTRFLKDDNLRASSWQILNFKANLDETIAQQVFESSPRDASALHVAAFWGFSKYVVMRVAHIEPGTSQISKHVLDKADSHGWTPLHWAVSMGHDSTARALLEAGSSPDMPDLAGWTPIFWAAFKGHAYIVETLLQHNAAAFLRDTRNLTPLHWATRAGDTTVVQRLLKVNVAPEKIGKRTKIACLPNLEDLTVSRAQAIANDNAKSPLELYSEATDIKVFSAIFNALKRDFRRKDVESRMDSHGLESSYYAPLIYGLFGPRLKGQYIRRSRPIDDYKLEKPDGSYHRFVDSLMTNATKAGNIPVMKLLLDLKAVDTNGINNLALLHDAAGIGSVEAVSDLISRGADVDQKDEHERVPLHRACITHKKEAIAMLLDVDSINVDARNMRSETPLMDLLTPRSGYPNEERGLRLVNLLLAKGASISAKDAQGHSLMHFAMRTWNTDIITMLHNAGLSMEDASNCGQLPLHWLAASSYLQHLKELTPDAAQSLKIKRQGCINLVVELSGPNALDVVCGWERWEVTYKQTPLSLALLHHNWDLAALLIKPIEGSFNPAQLLGTQDIDEVTWIICQLCKATQRLPSASKPREISNSWKNAEHPFYELEPLSLTSWTSILQYLLDTGADINETDWEGRSPLHLCVQRAASVPVIETLLKAGANPYQVTKKGLDCFQFALLYHDEAGSSEILSCFRTYDNTHPDPLNYYPQTDSAAMIDIAIDDEETYFLEALRQTNVINGETVAGRTLLYKASIHGQLVLLFCCSVACSV